MTDTEREEKAYKKVTAFLNFYIDSLKNSALRALLLKDSRVGAMKIAWKLVFGLPDWEA